MSTQQLYLPYDNSSAAQFIVWAGGVSSQLNTCGWTQTNDTGQVVFVATVFTLTQVVGATAVYSYSSYTGPAPRIGMSVIITGFATGANNVTATITALTGTTSGTFTVTRVAQVDETHAGSATTTVTTLPAANSFAYEIRVPASDPLQTGATAYYMKFEYGNSDNGGSSTNSPELRVSLGTGVNGSGTLTGFVIGPFKAHGSGAPVGAGAVNYECDFSWDTSRLNIMMWRNLAGFSQCFIGVERTKDATGADSSDGVTLVTVGGQVNLNGASQMRTIVFGIGISNLLGANNSTSIALPTIAIGLVANSAAASDAFNNNVPIGPLFPSYGKYGNPQTMLAFCRKVDFAEGALITTTLYGATRTYMGCKTGSCFGSFGIGQGDGLLMRFD